MKATLIHSVFTLKDEASLWSSAGGEKTSMAESNRSNITDDIGSSRELLNSIYEWKNSKDLQHRAKKHRSARDERSLIIWLKSKQGRDAMKRNKRPSVSARLRARKAKRFSISETSGDNSKQSEENLADYAKRTGSTDVHEHANEQISLSDKRGENKEMVNNHQENNEMESFANDIDRGRRSKNDDEPSDDEKEEEFSSENVQNVTENMQSVLANCVQNLPQLDDNSDNSDEEEEFKGLNNSSGQSSSSSIEGQDVYFSHEDIKTVAESMQEVMANSVQNLQQLDNRSDHDESERNRFDLKNSVANSSSSSVQTNAEEERSSYEIRKTSDIEKDDTTEANDIDISREDIQAVSENMQSVICSSAQNLQRIDDAADCNDDDMKSIAMQKSLSQSSSSNIEKYLENTNKKENVTQSDAKKTINANVNDADVSQEDIEAITENMQEVIANSVKNLQQMDDNSKDDRKHVTSTKSLEQSSSSSIEDQITSKTKRVESKQMDKRDSSNKRDTDKKGGDNGHDMKTVKEIKQNPMPNKVLFLQPHEDSFFEIEDKTSIPSNNPVEKTNSLSTERQKDNHTKSNQNDKTNKRFMNGQTKAKNKHDYSKSSTRKDAVKDPIENKDKHDGKIGIKAYEKDIKFSNEDIQTVTENMERVMANSVQNLQQLDESTHESDEDRKRITRKESLGQSVSSNIEERTKNKDERKKNNRSDKSNVNEVAKVDISREDMAIVSENMQGVIFNSLKNLKQIEESFESSEVEKTSKSSKKNVNQNSPSSNECKIETRHVQNKQPKTAKKMTEKGYKQNKNKHDKTNHSETEKKIIDNRKKTERSRDDKETERENMLVVMANSLQQIDDYSDSCKDNKKSKNTVEKSSSSHIDVSIENKDKGGGINRRNTNIDKAMVTGEFDQRKQQVNSVQNVQANVSSSDSLQGKKGIDFKTSSGQIFSSGIEGQDIKPSEEDIRAVTENMQNILASSMQNLQQLDDKYEGGKDDKNIKGNRSLSNIEGLVEHTDNGGTTNQSVVNKEYVDEAKETAGSSKEKQDVIRVQSSQQAKVSCIVSRDDNKDPDLQTSSGQNSSSSIDDQGIEIYQEDIQTVTESMRDVLANSMQNLQQSDDQKQLSDGSKDNKRANLTGEKTPSPRIAASIENTDKCGPVKQNGANKDSVAKARDIRDSDKPHKNVNSVQHLQQAKSNASGSRQKKKDIDLKTSSGQSSSSSFDGQDIKISQEDIQTVVESMQDVLKNSVQNLQHLDDKYKGGDDYKKYKGGDDKKGKDTTEKRSSSIIESSIKNTSTGGANIKRDTISDNVLKERSDKDSFKRKQHVSSEQNVQNAKGNSSRNRVNKKEVDLKTSSGQSSSSSIGAQEINISREDIQAIAESMQEILANSVQNFQQLDHENKGIKDEKKGRHTTGESCSSSIENSMDIKDKDGSINNSDTNKKNVAKTKDTGDSCIVKQEIKSIQNLQQAKGSFIGSRDDTNDVNLKTSSDQSSSANLEGKGFEISREDIQTVTDSMQDVLANSVQNLQQLESNSDDSEDDMKLYKQDFSSTHAGFTDNKDQWKRGEHLNIENERVAKAKNVKSGQNSLFSMGHNTEKRVESKKSDKFTKGTTVADIENNVIPEIIHKSNTTNKVAAESQNKEEGGNWRQRGEKYDKDHSTNKANVENLHSTTVKQVIVSIMPFVHSIIHQSEKEVHSESEQESSESKKNIRVHGEKGIHIDTNKDRVVNAEDINTSRQGTKTDKEHTQNLRASTKQTVQHVQHYNSYLENLDGVTVERKEENRNIIPFVSSIIHQSEAEVRLESEKKTTETKLQSLGNKGAKIGTDKDDIANVEYTNTSQDSKEIVTEETQYLQTDTTEMENLDGVTVERKEENKNIMPFVNSIIHQSEAEVRSESETMTNESKTKPQIHGKKGVKVGTNKDSVPNVEDMNTSRDNNEIVTADPQNLQANTKQDVQRDMPCPETSNDMTVERKEENEKTIPFVNLIIHRAEAEVQSESEKGTRGSKKKLQVRKNKSAQLGKNKDMDVKKECIKTSRDEKEFVAEDTQKSHANTKQTVHHDNSDKEYLSGVTVDREGGKKTIMPFVKSIILQSEAEVRSESETRTSESKTKPQIHGKKGVKTGTNKDSVPNVEDMNTSRKKNEIVTEDLQNLQANTKQDVQRDTPCLETSNDMTVERKEENDIIIPFVNLILHWSEAEVQSESEKEARESKTKLQVRKNKSAQLGKNKDMVVKQECIKTSRDEKEVRSESEKGAVESKTKLQIGEDKGTQLDTNNDSLANVGDINKSQNEKETVTGDTQNLLSNTKETVQNVHINSDSENLDSMTVEREEVNKNISPFVNSIIHQSEAEVWSESEKGAMESKTKLQIREEKEAQIDTNTDSVANVDDSNRSREEKETVAEDTQNLQSNTRQAVQNVHDNSDLENLDGMAVERKEVNKNIMPFVNSIIHQSETEVRSELEKSNKEFNTKSPSAKIGKNKDIIAKQEVIETSRKGKETDTKGMQNQKSNTKENVQHGNSDRSSQRASKTKSVNKTSLVNKKKDIENGDSDKERDKIEKAVPPHLETVRDNSEMAHDTCKFEVQINNTTYRLIKNSNDENLNGTTVERKDMTDNVKPLVSSIIHQSEAEVQSESEKEFRDSKTKFHIENEGAQTDKNKEYNAIEKDTNGTQNENQTVTTDEQTLKVNTEQNAQNGNSDFSSKDNIPAKKPMGQTSSENIEIQAETRLNSDQNDTIMRVTAVDHMDNAENSNAKSRIENDDKRNRNIRSETAKKVIAIDNDDKKDISNHREIAESSIESKGKQDSNMEGDTSTNDAIAKSLLENGHKLDKGSKNDMSNCQIQIENKEKDDNVEKRETNEKTVPGVKHTINSHRSEITDAEIQERNATGQPTLNERNLSKKIVEVYDMTETIKPLVSSIIHQSESDVQLESQRKAHDIQTSVKIQTENDANINSNKEIVASEKEINSSRADELTDTNDMQNLITNAEQLAQHNGSNGIDKNNIPVEKPVDKQTSSINIDNQTEKRIRSYQNETNKNIASMDHMGTTEKGTAKDHAENEDKQESNKQRDSKQKGIENEEELNSNKHSDSTQKGTSIENEDELNSYKHSDSTQKRGTDKEIGDKRNSNKDSDSTQKRTGIENEDKRSSKKGSDLTKKDTNIENEDEQTSNKESDSKKKKTGIENEYKRTSNKDGDSTKKGAGIANEDRRTSNKDGDSTKKGAGIANEGHQNSNKPTDSLEQGTDIENEDKRTSNEYSYSTKKGTDVENKDKPNSYKHSDSTKKGADIENEDKLNSNIHTDSTKEGTSIENEHERNRNKQSNAARNDIAKSRVDEDKRVGTKQGDIERTGITMSNIENQEIRHLDREINTTTKEAVDKSNMENKVISDRDGKNEITDSQAQLDNIDNGGKGIERNEIEKTCSNEKDPKHDHRSEITDNELKFEIQEHHATGISGSKANEDNRTLAKVEMKDELGNIVPLENSIIHRPEAEAKPESEKDASESTTNFQAGKGTEIGRTEEWNESVSENSDIMKQESQNEEEVNNYFNVNDIDSLEESENAANDTPYEGTKCTEAEQNSKTDSLEINDLQSDFNESEKIETETYNVTNESISNNDVEKDEEHEVTENETDEETMTPKSSDEKTTENNDTAAKIKTPIVFVENEIIDKKAYDIKGKGKSVESDLVTNIRDENKDSETEISDKTDRKSSEKVVTATSSQPADKRAIESESNGKETLHDTLESKFTDPIMDTGEDVDTITDAIPAYSDDLATNDTTMDESAKLNYFTNAKNAVDDKYFAGDENNESDIDKSIKSDGAIFAFTDVDNTTKPTRTGVKYNRNVNGNVISVLEQTSTENSTSSNTINSISNEYRTTNSEPERNNAKMPTSNADNSNTAGTSSKRITQQYLGKSNETTRSDMSRDSSSSTSYIKDINTQETTLKGSNADFSNSGVVRSPKRAEFKMNHTKYSSAGVRSPEKTDFKGHSRTNSISRAPSRNESKDLIGINRTNIRSGVARSPDKIDFIKRNKANVNYRAVRAKMQSAKVNQITKIRNTEEHTPESIRNGNSQQILQDRRIESSSSNKSRIGGREFRGGESRNASTKTRRSASDVPSRSSQRSFADDTKDILQKLQTIDQQIDQQLAQLENYNEIDEIDFMRRREIPKLREMAKDANATPIQRRRVESEQDIKITVRNQPTLTASGHHLEDGDNLELVINIPNSPKKESTLVAPPLIDSSKDPRRADGADSPSRIEIKSGENNVKIVFDKGRRIVVHDADPRVMRMSSTTRERSFVRLKHRSMMTEEDPEVSFFIKHAVSI